MEKIVSKESREVNGEKSTRIKEYGCEKMKENKKIIKESAEMKGAGKEKNQGRMRVGKVTKVGR